MHAEDSDHQPGSVVISIDAELGWGFHDLADPPSARVEQSRAGWDRLADLLDRYAVPATWAVVGHLLLDDCGGHHADHPAGDGWFSREREEWADRRELRFADGLIDRVLDAPVEHDVGCHTYSHVDLSGTGVAREVMAAELDRCRDLFDDYGLPFSSFVFPRNRIGHRDVLAEFGLDSYRSGRRPPVSALRKGFGAALGSFDPHLVEPSVDEYGLVSIPPSTYLYDFEGLFHRVAEHTVGDPIVREAKQGIDAAAQRGGIFHVWLHPNNLIGPLQTERCRRILAYVDERRDDVRVETMRDVAQRVKGERVRPESTVPRES